MVRRGHPCTSPIRGKSKTNMKSRRWGPSCLHALSFLASPKCIHCELLSQVLASMFKKKVEFFKVKWKGISTDGNTWEPAAHFEGDAAKAVLAAFRKARADDRHRQDDLAVAKLAGAVTAKDGRPCLDADAGSDAEVVVVEEHGPQKKIRQNRSDVWKFYFPRYWDAKGPSGKGYYAKCRLCQSILKVSNTTNLRGHLDKRHAGEMVEEAQTGKQVLLIL